METEKKKRRILVGVDESEESMYALKWALLNLRIDADDTLILCYAKRLPPSYQAFAGPGFTVPANLWMSIEKYLDGIASSVMSRATQLCSGITASVEEVVVKGDARDVLCEAVKDSDVDFLVMGSHGYGAIKRTLLGSVSDYCARHAKCPVMIVKKPQHRHSHSQDHSQQ